MGFSFAGSQSLRREVSLQMPAGFAVVRAGLPSGPEAADLGANQVMGRAAPAPASAFRGHCRDHRKPSPVCVHASGYWFVPGNSC